MGFRWKPLAAAAMAGASALALSGCLLTAGTFDSQLVLLKDGSFHYSYDGEIQMLALSELAEMGSKVDDVFEPQPCYTDDYEDRACTSEEIAAQKIEWEAVSAERAAEKQREAETAKALLGGIDPSNPEAGQDIADRLERQHGWNNVDYLGNGLFDVDFAIDGRLTHDFNFPVMERLPMGNPFLSVVIRDGAQIRVDAPGFVVQDKSDPMRGMMAGLIGLSNMEKSQEAEGDSEAPATPPRVVLPQGQFTIVTDGKILANNTDEGPSVHANGQQLTWTINARTEQPPMALISLSD